MGGGAPSAIHCLIHLYCVQLNFDPFRVVLRWRVGSANHAAHGFVGAPSSATRTTGSDVLLDRHIQAGSVRFTPASTLPIRPTRGQSLVALLPFGTPNPLESWSLMFYSREGFARSKLLSSHFLRRGSLVSLSVIRFR